MKKKKTFLIALISIVLVLYVAWKISWWYEDTQLEKQRLEELILHIREPALRDLEILDFHGTHKGWEWQGGSVARFIFYSKTNIYFPNMKKVFAIPYNEMRKPYLAKSIIEKQINCDIGNLKGEQVLHRRTDEKYQIKIRVIETVKGFYIEAEMIEI